MNIVDSVTHKRFSLAPRRIEKFVIAHSDMHNIEAWQKEADKADE